MFMVGKRWVDLEAAFTEAEQLFVLPSTSWRSPRSDRLYDAGVASA